MPREGEDRDAPVASGHEPGSPRDVAQWCAAQGWPVHPLAPGRKVPVRNCARCAASCREPAVCPCKPAGRPCHGFRSATTDPALIDRWWAGARSPGVGVACGGADMVVIDIDAHRTPVPARELLLPGITIPDAVRLDGLASGFDTLALLAAYRGHMSPAEDIRTLRVRTPSGGLHVWYRNPDTAVRYRCSTGSARHTALAWQVDVRADGGYIIAPGTRTAQGVYRAEGTARQPAPLPDWLCDELRRTGHVIQPQDGRAGPGTPAHAHAHAPAHTRAPALVPGPALAPGPGPGTGPGTSPRGDRAASAGEWLLDPLIAVVAECAEVPQGAGFTEKLNRAAYTAGGLVGAGRIDHAHIRDRLVRVAHYARPRQQARNEKIVDAALATGSVRPLHIEGRP